MQAFSCEICEISKKNFFREQRDNFFDLVNYGKFQIFLLKLLLLTLSKIFPDNL